jgi:phosphotransferase system HPr-like phosphotransfer protein
MDEIVNMYIHLRSGNLVKDFINTILPMKGTFELASGYRTVDAKSPMGIYTLDLSSPVLLRVDDASDEDIELIQPFVIKL